MRSPITIKLYCVRGGISFKRNMNTEIYDSLEITKNKQTNKLTKNPLKKNTSRLKYAKVIA